MKIFGVMYVRNLRQRLRQRIRSTKAGHNGTTVSDTTLVYSHLWVTLEKREKRTKHLYLYHGWTKHTWMAGSPKDGRSVKTQWLWVACQSLTEIMVENKGMEHTEIHTRRQVCKKNAGTLASVLIKCDREKGLCHKQCSQKSADFRHWLIAWWWI